VTEREQELHNEGWVRRFVASEPRLSEMATLYEESGFEVHLEPIENVRDLNPDSAECQQCTVCFDGVEDQYKVLFTRPATRDQRD
jgi:hypothetical protein